jgi:hypothetical protein
MEKKGEEPEEEESDISEDEKDSVRTYNEVKEEAFCRYNPIILELLTSQKFEKTQRVTAAATLKSLKGKNSKTLTK